MKFKIYFFALLASMLTACEHLNTPVLDEDGNAMSESSQRESKKSYASGSAKRPVRTEFNFTPQVNLTGNKYTILVLRAQNDTYALRTDLQEKIEATLKGNGFIPAQSDEDSHLVVVVQYMDFKYSDFAQKQIQGWDEIVTEVIKEHPEKAQKLKEDMNAMKKTSAELAEAEKELGGQHSAYFMTGYAQSHGKRTREMFQGHVIFHKQIHTSPADVLEAVETLPHHLQALYPPAKSALGQPSCTPYFGYRTQDSTKLAKITEVPAGTPAAVAGLQKGDELISINGIEYKAFHNPWSDDEHPRVAAVYEGGKPVSVKLIRNNKEIVKKIVPKNVCTSRFSHLETI